ncbi:hypothetical protein EG329_009054 [Mollisiaceae sp. DMI_Dod_QoI]|nr:hypothetical protein EG329_009054 [Helotiales sp. DMI_Dod_QoI]
MKGPMTYSEEQDALSMGYGHGFTDLLPKISYQDSQPKLKNEDPMLKMRLLMDQSIVQAAIDETIRASEKTQKRQHAEYEDDQEKSAAPPKPAKVAKKNAFSVMMTAKPKPAKWTNGIVSFEGMEVEFEQMLLGQHLDQHLNNGFLRRQHDGATSMASAITDWFKGRILPHLQRAPHMQTKINALHVLIEIAAGIAYAPES